jgi:hypothetical protein
LKERGVEGVGAAEVVGVVAGLAAGLEAVPATGLVQAEEVEVVVAGRGAGGA